jgi:hypothetical protein
MNIAATYTTLTATFWLTRLVMLVLHPTDPPQRKAVLDVAAVNVFPWLARRPRQVSRLLISSFSAIRLASAERG